MREANDMRGRMRIALIDRKGRIVLDRTQDNHIVQSGRLLVARLFAGPERSDEGESPDPETSRCVSFMGVGTGTGTGTETEDEKVLDTETALRAQRCRVQISHVEYEEFQDGGKPPVLRVRAKLRADFDYLEANGDIALTEAGIFNAANGGVMYNRAIFKPVMKTDSFKLTLMWDIVF